MAMVLDASAVAGLAFSDEDPTYARAVFLEASNTTAIVPILFRYEVRNALLSGERSRRIEPQQAAEFLEQLHSLELEHDNELNEASVFSLARQHQLTFYDAAYLEAAVRRRLPLATNDQALINAAPRVGFVRWTSIARQA